jgi:small conductance mechanosensitive channel
MENLLPKLWEILTTTGVSIGLKIVYALVIFIIGKWVAGLFKKSVGKMLNRKNVDATLVGFVVNLVYFIMLIFVALAALNVLGFQTTSFVAILAAAGFAIGMALQGGLANFAAGVLMLIFRPFKIGDFIEAGGTSGVVEEIQLFTTQMRTGDNKTIIVPNAGITGGNITNYSTKPTRRVDIVAGIGYEDDIDKAKAVLNDILSKNERVLSDPTHQVAVSELADSSVNFVVRAWVNSADYWDVYFDTTETIKKRFDEEKISIPFPQQDIHLYQHEK